MSGGTGIVLDKDLFKAPSEPGVPLVKYSDCLFLSASFSMGLNNRILILNEVTFFNPFNQDPEKKHFLTLDQVRVGVGLDFIELKLDPKIPGTLLDIYTDRPLAYRTTENQLDGSPMRVPPRKMVANAITIRFGHEKDLAEWEESIRAVTPERAYSLNDLLSNRSLALRPKAPIF